ncbi:MAG: cell division protein SepF [Candidatus Bathyarchaeota archaeon]|nr:cell division protein SepF [Candidatus Bathyarchaeota archaeon]
MPPLGIFHKPKKEDEKPEMPPSENAENTENKGKEENIEKTYLKAMPLRDLSDLEGIKNEVKNGNILILRITPLASKNIEDVKSAVNELYEFAESIGGDIARLGEERIVICPQNVRIWREKTPVTSEPVPTAA